MKDFDIIQDFKQNASTLCSMPLPTVGKCILKCIVHRIKKGSFFT